MIEMTEILQRELKEYHGYPPVLVNPRTGEEFRLLPTELYERVRIILEEEDELTAIREMAPLVDQATNDEDEVKSNRESA